MSGADTGGWLCIALECPVEEAGGVEEALEASGAIAVSLEDAGKSLGSSPGLPRRPLWGKVRVSGLFAKGVDGLERVAARLSPELLQTARTASSPKRTGPARDGSGFSR